MFGRNGNIKKFLKELDQDLSHIEPKKEEEGEKGEGEKEEVAQEIKAD